MSTVQQAAARLTKGAAESFVRNVKATPADKLEWRPLDEGRTVLSQAAECAAVAVFFTNILRDRAMPASADDTFERIMARLDTADKALAALEANTADLVKVIETFPDADLAGTVVMPWSPEPATFEDVLFMNYWNLVYHYGQTAYVQTLFGDREMH